MDWEQGSAGQAHQLLTALSFKWLDCLFMLKGLPQRASTFPVGHFTHSPHPYLYYNLPTQLEYTRTLLSRYYIPKLNKACFIYLEERGIIVFKGKKNSSHF